MADVDLRLRGGGRTTRDALNSASGSIESGRQGDWPPIRSQGWPPGDAEAARWRHRMACRSIASPAASSERWRGVAAPVGRRHAEYDPGRGRLRADAHGRLGIHPAPRSARQPEHRPRLAPAPQGRQPPAHDRRAGARSCPADRPATPPFPAWRRRSTSRRARPAPMPAPWWRRGSRLCAPGFARPAAGAHRGRCAPALGTPSEPEPDRETRPPALSHLVDGEAGGISARN